MGCDLGLVIGGFGIGKGRCVGCCGVGMGLVLGVKKGPDCDESGLFCIFGELSFLVEVVFFLEFGEYFVVGCL